MELKQISIDKIKPDKNQPRKTFDKETIKGLADTYKNQGVIEPIEVDENNIIVTGERRWRASKLAKINTIPCKIKRGLTKETRLERQLIEDIQKEGIPIPERDKGWWKLYEQLYPIEAKSCKSGLILSILICFNSILFFLQ